MAVNNETITKDLGPVSSYAVAVSEGFTGTKEEWESYIANASNNALAAHSNALKAEGYSSGTQNGTPVSDPQSPYYENNAEHWASEAAASAQEAETLIGDLAKEETLQEIESETEQSVNLLEQILEAGHSSGDLNGYSLAPGSGGEVILSYTDPETEETSSVVMITETTGAAIAEALAEEAEMWRGAVENAG